MITTSGIYGFITGEEGDKFWLEIDDDVQIRIARAAVQSKIDTSTGDAAGRRTSRQDSNNDDDDDDDEKSENS